MERSGLDILNELLEEIKLLHKKIDLMDKNLKSVANSAKLADLVTRATGTKFDAFSRANGSSAPTMQAVDVSAEIQKAKDKANDKAMRFKFEPSSPAKAPDANQNIVKNKKVVVTGKLITVSENQSSPLSQVDVKIFDDKDTLIKETKTNRAGHWISHLLPGKYVVSFSGEIGGKKLSPVNKSFIIPEGQDEFEVI